MVANSQSVKPVQSDDLSELDGIKHGFFTRVGGVSSGIYEGLNVGIGSHDSSEKVSENRRRVAEYFALPADKLSTVYQIHSPNVVIIEKPFNGERPKCDAIVTAHPSIAIGVLTADCGPVLFAEQKNNIIGAAHAGWKGATGGVLESTIEAMISIGADKSKIKAVLGPTISQRNYEVGPEFSDNLLSLDTKNQQYLIASEKPNHSMFDLPCYIIDRLKNNGIEASWTGNCTYADEELFFSYRRTTHRREEDYGRQISAIALEN